MNNKTKRRKISFDLDNDNINILETFKDDHDGLSNTSVLNQTIRLIYNLSPLTLSIINNACIDAFKKIQSQKGLMNSMEFGTQLDCANELAEIYSFLNKGAKLETAALHSQLIKYSLKNGIMEIPSDWIHIHVGQPLDCYYAGVIEVKNGTDFNVPHFFFFSEKPIQKLTSSEQSDIFLKCRQLSPAFNDALESEVDPIYENGILINEEDFFASPKPGIFEIPDAGSRGKDESNYPYGAKIHRTK